MQRDVTFASGGETCHGTLFYPDNAQPPYPLMIMAGGWCYVKEIVMPHHAAELVGRGVAALAFDYRRFGLSSGEPRQHIDPLMQIEDYRNCISFAEGLTEIDAARIGVWGISYSGGHVLIVGATDPRVRCVVSNIPVVEGFRTMRRVHGERRFQDLRDVIIADRRRRYADPDAAGTIPMSSANPASELSTWPFPSIREGFERLRQTEAPRHQHWSTIASVEMLLSYSVFPLLPRLVGVDTLMIVAERDEITLWDEEIAAHDAIPGVAKTLVVMPSVTHMSLYSDRSHLQLAAETGAEWAAGKLVSSALSMAAA
jgi:pimeloyl-ACP methyl ester carboxylesterase